jgi:hydrogenase-4 membrane subunit HyfE
MTLTWIDILVVLAFVVVVALLAPKIRRTFGRPSKRPSDWEGYDPGDK